MYPRITQTEALWTPVGALGRHSLQLFAVWAGNRSTDASLYHKTDIVPSAHGGPPLGPALCEATATARNSGRSAPAATDCGGECSPPRRCLGHPGAGDIGPSAVRILACDAGPVWGSIAPGSVTSSAPGPFMSSLPAAGAAPSRGGCAGTRPNDSGRCQCAVRPRLRAGPKFRRDTRTRRHGWRLGIALGHSTGATRTERDDPGGQHQEPDDGSCISRDCGGRTVGERNPQ